MRLKKKFFKLKQAAEAEEKKRKSEPRSMENRILQREESLDHRTDALEKREHQLSSLQGQLDRRKNDLDSLVSQQSQELEAHCSSYKR